MSNNTSFAVKLILAISISWILPILVWMLTCVSHTFSYTPLLYASNDTSVKPEYLFDRPALGKNIMDTLSLEDALKAIRLKDQPGKLDPGMLELFRFSEHMHKAAREFADYIVTDRKAPKKLTDIIALGPRDPKHREQDIQKWILENIESQLKDKPLIRKRPLPKWSEPFFERVTPPSDLDPRVRQHMKAHYLLKPTIPANATSEQIAKINADFVARVFRVKEEMRQKYVIYKDQTTQVTPQTRYLIVTHQELRNAKQHLDTVFTQRPDLWLVLDFDQETEVKLSGDDLPASVKKLSVMGENVKVVKEQFLEGSKLIDFDMSKWINLEIIKPRFLSNSSSLEAIYLFGLKKLRIVEDLFLNKCIALKSIDGLVDWINLKKIGRYFLLDCRAVPFLDVSRWDSLEEIEEGFGYGCKKLSFVNMSGCVKLKTIGPNFLRDCELLERFNMSGCIKLEEIGESFLNGCEALVYFKRLDRAEMPIIIGRYSFRNVSFLLFNDGDEWVKFKLVDQTAEEFGKSDLGKEVKIIHGLNNVNKGSMIYKTLLENPNNGAFFIHTI
ncbi:MAG: leucine-rich repeat protein [Alphaproteobacteria bacterium]|nr:MAG: leucine-rich repeat protein [Alphaproteobacteria bacterium]